ncbi:GSCOCG00012858001-RA-CDS, partial [Cotesia congregata]
MNITITYSLYVSDLGKLLQCKYLFYADDLVVYLSCNPASLNTTIRELNEIIKVICGWCDDNDLKLNADKTKCIIFGSPYNVSLDQCKSCYKITVNQTVIDFVSSVQYLGIILDNTLSWNDQIDNVCKRSMRVLAIKLMTTLVFPIFDYCALIYTNITQKQQCKLQRKLNACVRFIFKISR